jgi:hypothetical protein
MKNKFLNGQDWKAAPRALENLRVADPDGSLLGENLLQNATVQQLIALECKAKSSTLAIITGVDPEWIKVIVPQECTPRLAIITCRRSSFAAFCLHAGLRDGHCNRFL